MPIFPIIMLAAGLIGGGLVGRYVVPQNTYTDCVSALISAGISSTQAATNCQGSSGSSTNSTISSIIQPLIVPGIIFGAIAIFGPKIISGVKGSFEKALTSSTQSTTSVNK